MSETLTQTVPQVDSDHPFQLLLDTNTAQTMKEANESFEKLTKEIESKLVHLKENHRTEYTAIIVAHEQLVYETQMYATNLISFMEEIMDMVESENIGVLSDNYVNYVDRRGLDKMLDACLDLIVKCRVLLENINNDSDYGSNQKVLIGQSVGAGVAALALAGGIAACIVDPLLIPVGVGAIVTGAVGGGAAAFGIVKSIEAIHQVEKTIRDLKHRRNGAQALKQNLLVIKQKARNHYGKRSLLHDAQIVIHNCNLLRGNA